MNLITAAQLLGGEATPSRNSVLCPGPGHSATDRSLNVTFSGDDFVVYSHANDAFSECRDYVKSRLGLPSNWKPAANAFDVNPEDKQADDEKRLKLVLRIWDKTRPIRSTLAETYLNSRGCYVEGVHDLRFDANCYYAKDDYRPAMIGLFRNIVTGEPTGLHRTFLNPDGTKFDRKMLGVHIGSAIKLIPDFDVTYGLTIGEGVETCLSGIVLGYQPCWIMGSAGNIAAFPQVSGIETITVLLENDATGTNEKSVRTMAERLKSYGMSIRGRKSKFGSDANDELRELLGIPWSNKNETV